MPPFQYSFLPLPPPRPAAPTAHPQPQVSPAKAALLLGVSEADARQLAASLGWAEAEVEGCTMLQPKEATQEGNGLDSRAALEQLTQYMVHLES